MVDLATKDHISYLLSNVQLATQSEKSVFDVDYIEDVNKRVGYIEEALIELKNELRIINKTSHD